MKNFTSVLKYIFVALLTLVGATAVFGQTIQPVNRCMVYPHVVNMAQVAQYELQHPVKPQYPNALGGVAVNHEHANSNYVNATRGVPTGNVDSVPASPAPDTSFIAQYYDDYIEPCPHGAVNDSFLASVTAYNLVIQNRFGLILNQVSLPDFWAAAVPFNSIWANKLDYDRSTGRWIITCFSDEYTDTAGVLMGISQTDDPRGNWNLYKVPADSAGLAYSNFPQLGFNKNWIAVSGSRYAVNGPAADSSNLYVFNKGQIMSGAGANYNMFLVEGTRCALSSPADSLIGNIYILNEWNNNLGQLRLQEITGQPGSPAISDISFPTSSIPYASEAPNFENFAPQLGSPVKFQTDDDKPTSLVYANGNLWFVQTVFLPAANPTRSSLQWWEIDTLGNILQLGLVDDSIDNMFYAYPSIAVNQFNDALIGYSVFSPQIYASAAYSYHSHLQAAGVADSSYIFIAGGSPYLDTTSGGENYWGSWSATVVDPIDNSGFWTIEAYAAAQENTWNAQWANVDEYVATAVKNVAQIQPTVQLFPNPTNGTFNLTIEGVQYSTAQVKMFDLLGNEVFTTVVNTGGSANAIPVVTQGLAKGLYMAEIEVNGSTTMQKLVIQ